MHTYECVYMCILRNRLVFALYLWQEHNNYFIVFQVVPLNRGSLNTGNIFFFNLHAGKLELQKNIVVTAFKVCVWWGKIGQGPDLGFISQLPVVGDTRSLLSSLPRAARRRVKMAVNHYCCVQNCGL